jgi:hypothetical protein
MKEKNRFSKPVAFNSKNAEDQQILKRVKGRNFSGYVKKLILADIKERETLKAQNEAIKSVSEDKETKTRTEPDSNKTKEPKTLTAAEKIAKMKKELENKKPDIAPGPKMFN